MQPDHHSDKPAEPLIAYETNDAAISVDRKTFIWEEGPGGLCVRLPAPLTETRHLGCAVAIFTVGALILVPLALLAMWSVLQDPSHPVMWCAVAVVGTITVAFLWYLFGAIRKEAIPPQPEEPSILTIRGNELRIERTGSERNIDVSWDLSEVTDIRLFKAPDLPFIWGVVSFLHALARSDDLMEITVVLPSGQFEDVTVRVPTKHWIPDLETKLRNYLHLT